MVAANLPAAGDSRRAFEDELARIAAGDTHPPAETGKAGDSHVATEPAESTRRMPTCQPTIRELPNGQRPRERLRELGPQALNQAELLAILLRTGMPGENVVNMATRIIAEFGGLSGLCRADYAELNQQRGLSDAKACQVIAALELGRRVAALPPTVRPQISCAQDAAKLIAPDLEMLDQEHLIVLLLNTRNHVLVKRTVYVGTVNSSAVRPAEVLRPAVRENAPSIIVAHNHPSGDPTPSPEDVSITRDLVAAGKLMDIEVLDHLVIGSGGAFVSLKEKGLGFSQP